METNSQEEKPGKLMKFLYTKGIPQNAMGLVETFDEFLKESKGRISIYMNVHPIHTIFPRITKQPTKPYLMLQAEPIDPTKLPRVYEKDLREISKKQRDLMKEGDLRTKLLSEALTMKNYLNRLYKRDSEIIGL